MDDKPSDPSPAEQAGPGAPPTFTGQTTPIEGVVDSSASIVGTQIAWGDPVDLPVADNVAGLVILHVPRYLDPGRHHQQTPEDYLDWLVEVVDEAERVLEVGGRMVLVAKPFESEQPLIDVPSQLARPLASAGFIDPIIRTWLPDPAEPQDGAQRSEVLEQSARSWWRVLIAGKGQDHRAGSARQRRRLGLPHSQGAVPDHLVRLAGRAHWPIASLSPGREVAQGDLPAELVGLVVSCFSYVDDVVICPLTGPSRVVADVAGQLRRRALCFEPDQAVLARLNPAGDQALPDQDQGGDR